MLYRFVRPLAAVTLKVNFRKIHFSNIDEIPEGCPVIFAVNHPTAFIEPCIMACFQPHPLHFLVRGDFFRNRFFRNILERLHMIPIYRLKDGGYSKLKDNYVTMERCFEALRKNKALMILAEGSCVHEKRVRPIRKGTARIAFGAFEKFQIRDIQIVPVGVNYTFSDRFRSDIMMEVGKPILLEDYLDQYQEEPLKAIRELTTEIGVQLAKKVIIIDRPEDEELVEQLFELNRNNQPFTILPVLEKNPGQLHVEKALADGVNRMQEQAKKELQSAVASYFARLKELQLTDFGLVQTQHGGLNNTLTLLVGFIPFVFGVLGNGLPILLAKLIIDALVSSIEFRQAVKIATALGFYLIYFIVFFVLSIYWKSVVWTTIVLLLPIWGYFAVLYYDFFQRWRQSRKVNQLSLATQNSLRSEREKLLNLIRSEKV